MDVMIIFKNPREENWQLLGEIRKFTGCLI